MNRRNLIKVLGVSAVGLATVPLWLDNWTSDSLPDVTSGANKKQKLLLADLTGIIIPVTEIPGARELEVDKFILTMVAGCYEKEIQDQFLEGLGQLDASAKDKFGKDFVDLPDSQKLELSEETLSREAQEAQGFKFVSFVKGLTIAGYMNSKYVMENIIKYEFVPSRFNGSFKVDVNTSNTA